MSKVIVITGSTRGIGYGLADSFLSLGCQVVVSGRSQERVDQAVKKLIEDHTAATVMGYPCDVRDSKQVQSLWSAAVNQFGEVDIWVNNAGLASDVGKLWMSDSEQIQIVMDTNIVGAFNGMKVAMIGMLDQGFGSVYFMEGAGSNGRIHDGMSVYGTSKYALHYLSQALAKEAAGTPIIVGSLRPGMVITELVTDQFKDRPEDWERAKKIFNIIADRVETVTPWLAEKMLANQKSGVVISWSSSWKIMGRFILNLFKKRDLFGEV